MIVRITRAAGVAAALGALSCAHAPPAPERAPKFTDSPAFAEVRGHAFAILERDLDGDGLDEAVVGLEVVGGWVVLVFGHVLDEEGRHEWFPSCQGPAMTGSELGNLAWVEMSDGPLILLVGDEDEPDELIQSIVLVDPTHACAARLQERLVLTKPAGDVLAPGPVPGGAWLRGGVLLLTDRPEATNLEGPDGAASVLTSVRLRRVGGTREKVEVAEGTIGFLEPRTLSATWRGGGEPMTLEMLTDGDDVTAFVARPDETGTLTLTADGDLSLLIVHHGCAEDVPAQLSLRVGTGTAWTLGSPVPPGSFVRAAGRSHGHGGVRRDLVALSEPTRELEVELGPVDRGRCVREVRGLGFKER